MLIVGGRASRLAVPFVVATLGLLLDPGAAAARSRRGSVRARPKPTGTGLVIELKTTRVTLEANRPDVVLEAMLGPDAGEPSADASARAEAGGGADKGASAAPTKEPSVRSPDAETVESATPDGAGEPGFPLDEATWDVACTPPCDRSLPRDALFRISGPGIITSSTFRLAPDRAEARVRVRAGSTRWYWTGVIASAFGGSFVIGGAAPPLIGGGSFSTTEKVLTGTGVLLLAGGLPLFILNRTTVLVF